MGLKTRLFDAALSPLVALAAWPMRAARRGHLTNKPMTGAVLRRFGVFPLVDSYYEPLFDTSGLSRSNEPRELPGVEFAFDQQVALLKRFEGSEVLEAIPAEDNGGTNFYMNNSNFEAGDAELWFHVIQHFKPSRIVEIGSGHSTRMARIAIDRLVADDAQYRCEHVCIEPYEMPWLEQLDVKVIRERVEEVDRAVFDQLGKNDILFIDSSHIIRPQGDVLKEYLEILPRLAPGVIVHVHDIFSPRDYPLVWVEQPRFWNEQYLLEAFLTHSGEWEVLLAANQLKHDAYDELKRVCPHLHKAREPGSFYMRRKDAA
jgi:hypothetical protein